jgi:eukaryotic-like serine/threonine-protein kinase
MTRHRSRAIHHALLAIALSAVLSSCGEAISAAHTAASSGSAPGSGSPSGRPVTSNSASTATATPGTSSSGTSATATSTTVPDVASQPVPEATQNLRQAGLAVGMQKHEPNLNIPADSVITTDPAAFSPEPAGYIVNLIVSTGAPWCPNCIVLPFPMPNVVGQTLYQAKTTLAEQGLSLETYSFQESSAPQGQVTQSTPSAGTPTTTSFGVTLVISSGPASPSSVSPSTGSPSISPSTASPSVSSS